jgi:hypothetical protein
MICDLKMSLYVVEDILTLQAGFVGLNQILRQCFFCFG